MPHIHIANIDFEQELQSKTDTHPIYLQLQFLPLLYQKPEDALLVSQKPSTSYLENLAKKNIYQGQKIYCYEDTIPKNSTIESWGYSKKIALFAKKHALIYDMPDINTVKTVHSKLFSPSLREDVCILNSQKELKDWFEYFPFPKILKAPLSQAGRGSLILLSKKDRKKLKPFILKESFPLRGEKWFQRCFDFSTQWFIQKDKTVQFLSESVIKNSASGKYQSTLIGDSSFCFGPYLSFLEDHKKKASLIAEQIAAMGYFGNLGFDSFITSDTPKNRCILSEINARKTMSYCAFVFRNQFFPQKNILFSFTKELKGLLPTYLGKHSFKHQIQVQVLQEPLF